MDDFALIAELQVVNSAAHLPARYTKLMNNVSQIAYQSHFVHEWEKTIKDFISSIKVSDDTVWYRLGKDYKKISEELIPLGFYVQYKYGLNSKIKFKLIPPEEMEKGSDGIIIFPDENKSEEKVQITSASRTEEWAQSINDLIENKKGVIHYPSSNSKIKELIFDRAKGKIERGITIDTILIGTPNGFCRRIKSEYPDFRNELKSYLNEQINHKSNFKRVAIVEDRLVVPGDFIEFNFA